MKLLGWMHRKFRQNSNEPLKDLVIGHACNCLLGQPMLDDHCSHRNPSHGSKSLKQCKPEGRVQKSFSGLEQVEEDPSAGASEIFHGFLAIGTMGSDHGFSGQATPTFANSVENITEKDLEVTENELKLINDELEKVLAAEANEEWCNASSGRNSLVSNGRSSHGSTITLGGKPMDGQEITGRGSTNICPLQEFLFGSAIEMSETTAAAATREQRTSLGELFQRSKTAEDGSPVKCDPEESRLEKEAENDKSTTSLVMNKLKKKMLLKGYNRSSALKSDSVSTSAEKTLHKIFHMFHKKVHPENANAAKGSAKRSKKKPTADAGSELPGDCDIVMYPRGGEFPMVQWLSSKSHKKSSRECWIKTDADYLVLEL